MNTGTIDESQRGAARVVGLAFPIAFATVVAVNFGIFARLIVPGNPAETARRIMASEGMVLSAWCAACTFVFYIFPGFSKTINLWWFDSPMAVFELALSFWLLFKGLSTSGVGQADQARGRAESGAA